MSKRKLVLLEKDVQKAGIALLRSMNWIVHRRNVGAFKVGNRYIRASKPGMADTFGQLPDGRNFELEFKRPGKRPTPAQLEWLISTNGHHCCSFWVDNTATLEVVARQLTAGFSVSYHDEDFYQLVAP